MNDAAIQLADEKERKKFVAESVKRIEESLLSLVRH